MATKNTQQKKRGKPKRAPRRGEQVGSGQPKSCRKVMPWTWRPAYSRGEVRGKSLFRSSALHWRATDARRKPFQSAMSMLNFHINRGGSGLTAQRRRVLNQAKDELRKVFERES